MTKHKRRTFCSRSCAHVGNTRGTCSLEEELQKFWDNVHKTDFCWIWTGWRSNQGKGYGRCNLNGVRELAHRVSWRIHNNFEEIPVGKFVCHSCDNPGCVRPDHFFLGSNRENMHDAQRKGRLSSGDKHREAIIRGLVKGLAL